jgi:hypothetical protein
MSRGYNSFSGVNIREVFGPGIINPRAAQDIAYNITRERAPLYEMYTEDEEVTAYRKQMKVVYG